MSNQGDRDSDGNPRQTGNDPATPTGTSGRQGNKGTENWQQGNSDTNRQSGSRPAPDDDDEDEGPGNRMG